MSSRSNRFVPALDVLDARINMSALAATPDAPPEVGPDAADVTPLTAKNEAEASNQGWGAWEVNAAAEPDAGADGRKYKVLVAPLVVDTTAVAAQVRHRTFAVIDRTEAGGITKLGSKRLTLQAEETHAGAPERPVGANESITIGGPQVETAGPGSFTAEAPDETGLLVPAVQKVRDAGGRMLRV